MGRRRIRDKHLPARVYLKCGTYWFRPLGRKPVNLGRDLPEAIARYANELRGAWAGRTIGDVIERYRTEVLPLKRSPQTRKDEARALDRLKRVYGHLIPDGLTAPMLYRYLDERKTADGRPAPVAARHEIALLRHVYRKAIRWGIATRNPVRGIEFPAPAGQRRQVTLEEVAAVRALCTDRMQLAIDLALSLGQRRGDLLDLKRSDLTPEGILYRQGKTQTAVLVAWSPDLEAIVARAKAMAPQVPAEYLVRTRSGRRYTPGGFTAIWQRVMSKYLAAGGLRFTFHDLRSVSADAAETLEEARDRLGHASAATTQRFYRRAPRRAKPRT